MAGVITGNWLHLGIRVPCRLLWHFWGRTKGYFDGDGGNVETLTFLRVLVIKELLTGTVPVNKKLLTGPVLVNNFLQQTIWIM